MSQMSMPKNCQCGNMPSQRQMNNMNMYQRQMNESPMQRLNNMSQCQLLQYITEVSFARDDILLYLDTHPCDSEALNYSREVIGKREEAMAVYARKFGPLTIDSTKESESSRWDWVMQPWPWEPAQKGGNR